MIRKLKRIAVMALAISIGFAPAAKASILDDALNGMFMSNSTTPKTFKTQQMGGLVGGGFALRTPVTGPNIIAFDPPRISAGCGGIDLFGGSFSFINAQELVALFRQIAANAIGLAFKAAIDAINPALGKLMTDFQHMVAAMNNAMKNTCGLATALMNDTGISQDISSFVQQETSGPAAAISGATTDVFGQIDQFLNSPNGPISILQQAGQTPQFGNQSWMAINQSGSARLLGQPGVSNADPNESAQIIMSLIGTVITSPPDQNTSQATTAPNGATYVQGNPAWYPTLTLRQLRDGDENGQAALMQLYCSDGNYSTGADGCLSVNTKPLTFPGIKGYANEMLFGTEDGSSVTASSIVGLMDSCSGSTAGNGCNFTTAQTTFIGSLSAPIIAIMKKVQALPGGPDAIAYMLAPVITDELMEAYGNAALQASRASFSGTAYVKSQTITDAINSLSAEMIQIHQSDSDDMQKLTAAIAYAEEIVKNNPSTFVKPQMLRH